MIMFATLVVGFVVVSLVVRARSAVNQCANHCNSFGERERETERERESASKMWSSAEPAPAPAPAPAPIFKPGLCTNGRPTHLVTVKALPLSLPLLFARSLSLSLTRAQRSGRRSALPCSALHVCASVYVCVCERACV